MATTETGPALRAKIEGADRKELGRLYEELVGYDPFEEVPPAVADDVRATLVDYCEEAGLL